jgi:DNA-binding response OmpR family regulator
MKSHRSKNVVDDAEGSALNTANKNSILVISQRAITQDLYAALLSYNFRLINSESLSNAISILCGHAINLVMIDVSRSCLDSILTIRRLLLLTNRPGILARYGSSDEVDRIIALDVGADDCVDASCSAREVAARAAAIVRRTSGLVHVVKDQVKCELSGWELQSSTKRLVTPNKENIDLTHAEYFILSCLANDPGDVKSRSELNGYQNKQNNNDSDLRSLDVLVSRLRKKITKNGDQDIIETVRRVGYRLIIK